MNKPWSLLLHDSFIDCYLDDLNDEEKLEVIQYIFCWKQGKELPTLKSKLSLMLVKNTVPILETKKRSYENGTKGGAPIGNNNARKQPKNNLKTTPLVLEKQPENNLKTTTLVLEKQPKNNPPNNLNNNNNDNNNVGCYYHNNTTSDVVDSSVSFSFDSFHKFFPEGKNSFTHQDLSSWDRLMEKEKELIFDLTPKYIDKLQREGKEKYIKSLNKFLSEQFWRQIDQFRSRYIGEVKEPKKIDGPSQDDPFGWIERLEIN
jgi:hypothetical protein